MKGLSRVAIVLALTFASFVSALSDGANEKIPTTPKLAGVYSDLAYVDQSGDVLGIEVILVFSRKGYYAVFQSSEGEPTVPVVVEVRVLGNDIEFTLPEGPSYSGRFKGHISAEGLTGRFENGSLSPWGKAEIKLPRGKSYWQ